MESNITQRSPVTIIDPCLEDHNITNLLTNQSWITPENRTTKDPCLFSELNRNITTLLSPDMSANTIDMECIKNSTFFHTDFVNPPLSCSVYQNSHICQRNADNKDVFLLIIVLSSTTERIQRDAIRRTWGNVTIIDGKRVARIFLLGKSMDKTVEEKVAKENDQHRDILCKDDFLDTYANLTLKTLMGFRWAYAFCPTATFILKMDSDMVTNLNRLMKDLQNLTSSKNIVQGRRWICAEPIRRAATTNHTNRRWTMTLNEYPWSAYPPYVAGPSNLSSRDLLPRILTISLHVKISKLKMHYVGMILQVIGVVPELNHRFTQISICQNPDKCISNCYWHTVLCGRELDIFWLQTIGNNFGVLKNYCLMKNITSDTTLPYRI